MTRKVYDLIGAGFLHVSGLNAEFRDYRGKTAHLTNGNQAFLACLAHAEGKLVSHEELFRAYTQQEPTGNYKETINSAKGDICEPIRSYVKNSKGKGYYLNMARVREVTEDQALLAMTQKAATDVNAMARNLVGDYFGFYLDQIGDGSVLGIWLRIEDTGDQVMARAVLGIQSDDMFWDSAFPDILKGDRDLVLRNHKDFSDPFSPNEQRCFYADGLVTSHQNYAVITMKTLAGASWSIILDMGKYLECAAYIQNIHTERGYPYRGGMGLLFALAGSHGNFCCRCGLVRRDCMKPSLRLDNKNIVEWLKISLKREWKPLSLDGDLDKEWYNWFMKLKV